MKTKVEEYAKGDFGAARPKVSISKEYLQLKIEAGTTFEDEILIKAENDYPIRGMVYDDRYCFTFNTHNFVERKFILKLSFDATRYKKGVTFRGCIHVITDGGEFNIPYDIEVVSPYITTDKGPVNDMFSFASLAEENWSEAIGIFESSQFRRTFLKEQANYEKIYDSLSKSLSANQALEEFLVYIHKKRTLTLSVANSTYTFAWPNMKENKQLPIIKNTWGYTCTEVKTDARFIEINKKHILSEDFIGNSYELEYFINPEALYEETNVGHIILENVYQTINIEIIIKRPKKDEYVPLSKGTDKHSIKVNQVRLVNRYLEFRIGKIDLKDYIDKSLFALANLIKYLPEESIYKLGVMHMHILSGDIELVNQEFLRIEADGHRMIEGDMENCYFRYLKALLTKDNDAIEKAVELIKLNLNNSKTNQLFYFWLLMYLDTEYNVDKSLLYKKILELYDDGVNSPILFYEVCDILNAEPLMLRHLDDLMIRSVKWGFEHNYVSKEVMDTFIDMASREKNYNPRMFRLLREIYEKTPDTKCLAVICSMLIRGNVLDNSNHKYFAKAVDANLKLIGINEIYLRTMDTKNYDIIPHSVLLYLNYKNTLTEAELCYLYANIVTNKDSYMNIYADYINNIEAFMEDQILKGNMSDDLAVIYSEYLEPRVVAPQYASKLVNIVFKRKITIDNPNIRYVIVGHKELDSEVKVPVIDGEAYIEVFTDMASVSLVDNKGNRYVSTIPYKIHKLVDEKVYMDICLKYSGIDYRVLLYVYNDMVKRNISDAKLVNTCREILNTPFISYYTRQQALYHIIKYYFENYDRGVLEKYLSQIDLEQVDISLGHEVTTYFLIAGMYNRAFEALTCFGYDKLDEDLLVSMFHELAYDETYKGNDSLTAIARYLYLRGKESDAVLEWLVKYYESCLDDMISLWKRAVDHNVNTHELEENILAHMMFANCKNNDIYRVFQSYYKGQKKGMVVKGFLKLTAYNYFIKEEDVPDEIFDYIFLEIDKGNIFDQISTVAMLYNLSTKQISDKYIPFIKSSVRKFIDLGIVLPFFRAFKDVVVLPKDLFIKTYLVFKSDASRNINVSYWFGTSEGEAKNYKTARLNEVLPGLYIKEFVVFHGEKLSYSIIEDIKGEASIIENNNLEPDNFRGDYSDNDSRFALLNSMLINQEMREDKELVGNMTRYVNTVHLFEENLHIL